MYWLERYVTEGIEYVIDEEGDDIESELSEEDFIERLRNHFDRWRAPNVFTCWERVIWGGKCAVDNACDLNSGVLEWNADIERALRSSDSFCSYYAAESRRHGDRLAGVAS